MLAQVMGLAIYWPVASGLALAGPQINSSESAASSVSGAALASYLDFSRNSSAAPARPPLRLTFQALLRSSAGTIQDVSADAQRLVVSIRALDGSAKEHNTSDQFAEQHDGQVFDFAHGRQFSHQRFFDETVCYRVDFVTGVTAQDDQITPEQRFLSAVGQAFGAPLDLYDNESIFNGEREVAGSVCYAWEAHRAVRTPARGRGQDELVVALGLGSSGRARFGSALANQSEAIAGGGSLVLSTNATFCVTPSGEVLAVNATRRLVAELPASDDSGNDSVAATLWEEVSRTSVVSAVSPSPELSALDGEVGVAGPCVDLTSGTTGPVELHVGLNSGHRLTRINNEANGWWKAAPYEIWDGLTVQDIKPTLGTNIQPLRLPLRRSHPELRRGLSDVSLAVGTAGTAIPAVFDARERWSNCLSIGTVRNQGACGSCWAFAAASVLADRFCIAEAARTANRSTSLLQTAALSTLTLAPEHLVNCDSNNRGCAGGRLDDAWWFLRDHGVPQEMCSPYRHCPVPTRRKCAMGEVDAGAEKFSTRGVCIKSCHGGNPMQLYHASSAYAVTRPGDVTGLQRELLRHGPVEVAFFVFSDFLSYRRGVYFRTPGAYGPLGGHAVRLIGWGTLQQKVEQMDYWLAANSWSPEWGLGGFFRIRRGTNECGIETTPAAGLPHRSSVASSSSHASGDAGNNAASVGRPGRM